MGIIKSSDQGSLSAVIYWGLSFAFAILYFLCIKSWFQIRLIKIKINAWAKCVGVGLCGGDGG